MHPKMNVVIPNELKRNIIQFALSPEYTKYFQMNANPARRFCNLNTHNSHELTQAVKHFAKQAYAQIGVPAFIEEHMFGNFIGVNTEGGSVHQHMDPRDANGNYHLRLNFLIQKPMVGGDPIINDITYTMNDGDAWINYASEWMHGSSPVQGHRERIVLSLGAYVNPIYVEKITAMINTTDYSRVLEPQADGYDIGFFKTLKQQQGWVPNEYPTSLVKLDKVAVLPRNEGELEEIYAIDFAPVNEYYKTIYPRGYRNIVELVDFYVPDFRQHSNFSGQYGGADVGHAGGWGIMSTYVYDNFAPTFVNLMHELMHWKLVALGFGTGPNTFFPTTQEFILNHESELCWSIVNSYADTAQPAVGNKPTNRPVSASLHAYLSFLSVAYTHVQVLKHQPTNQEAQFKATLWGGRFNKCLDELWKVGKFTDSGVGLMQGITSWTAQFHREYNEIKPLLK